MDTKNKIKSIVKEEIVASCVRTLKRVAEIPEDELKKFLMKELPKALTDLGESLNVVLDKLSEVKSHYPPPPVRKVLVPPPLTPEAPPRPKKVPKKRSGAEYA